MSFALRINQNGTPGKPPALNAVVLNDIKSLVRPIFLSSDNARDLNRRLDQRGFLLRRFEGQNYLATAPHGELICKISEI